MKECPFCGSENVNESADLRVCMDCGESFTDNVAESIEKFDDVVTGLLNGEITAKDAIATVEELSDAVATEGVEGIANLIERRVKVSSGQRRKEAMRRKRGPRNLALSRKIKAALRKLGASKLATRAKKAAKMRGRGRLVADIDTPDGNLAKALAEYLELYLDIDNALKDAQTEEQIRNLEVISERMDNIYGKMVDEAGKPLSTIKTEDVSVATGKLRGMYEKVIGGKE